MATHYESLLLGIHSKMQILRSIDNFFISFKLLMELVLLSCTTNDALNFRALVPLCMRWLGNTTDVCLLFTWHIWNQPILHFMCTFDIESRNYYDPHVNLVLYPKCSLRNSFLFFFHYFRKYWQMKQKPKLPVLRQG